MPSTYEIPSHWQRRPRRRRPEWQRADGIEIVTVPDHSEFAEDGDVMFQPRSGGRAFGERCCSLEEAIEMVDWWCPIDDEE